MTVQSPLGARGKVEDRRSRGIRSAATTSAQGGRAWLDEMMALTPSEEGGKLILWHSAPGAGKSFALRSLAKAWASWCNVNYIMDPDALLTDSHYLMSTLLNDDREYDPELPREDRNKEDFRWNLYVLEDADEFITADAKERSGAALGRLLNLTDGLLGQGLGILIMITTNAPISSMHKAVVRPGRCLADIEFTSLSAEESRAWLAEKMPWSEGKCVNKDCEDGFIQSMQPPGDKEPCPDLSHYTVHETQPLPTIDGPRSLAELYELTRPRKKVQHAEKKRVGFLPRP